MPPKNTPYLNLLLTSKGNNVNKTPFGYIITCLGNVFGKTENWGTGKYFVFISQKSIFLNTLISRPTDFPPADATLPTPLVRPEYLLIPLIDELTNVF